MSHNPMDLHSLLEGQLISSRKHTFSLLRRSLCLKMFTKAVAVLSGYLKKFENLLNVQNVKLLTDKMFDTHKYRFPLKCWKPFYFNSNNVGHIVLQRS
jgi:hypothetical protein